MYAGTSIVCSFVRAYLRVRMSVWGRLETHTSVRQWISRCSLRKTRPASCQRFSLAGTGAPTLKRGAAKREVWVSKYQDVLSISRRCTRDGISKAPCTKFPHAKRQHTYRPHAFRCAKRIRPKAGTCWGAAEAEGRSPELREGPQSQTRSDNMGSE